MKQHQYITTVFSLALTLSIIAACDSGHETSETRFGADTLHIRATEVFGLKG